MHSVATNTEKKYAYDDRNIHSKISSESPTVKNIVKGFVQTAITYGRWTPLSSIIKQRFGLTKLKQTNKNYL